MEVVCSPSGGFGASSSICQMTLPEAACTLLGLSSGEYSFDDLESYFDCSNTETMLSAVDVYRCCNSQHEYTHVCVGGSSDPVEAKCNEVDANSALNTCFSSSIEDLCGGESPALGSTDCSTLCNGAYGASLISVWDECMCGKIQDEGEVSASASACCDCADECNSGTCAASGSLPSLCLENGYVECSSEPCSEADGSGGHNCAYYGGPSDFNVNEDCGSTTTLPPSSTTSST